MRSAMWIGVLLVDTWGLSRPLVEVRPEASLYSPSACVRYVGEQRQERGRVLDINPSSDEWSANATPLWPGIPAICGIEPIRGFNPVDILRYKEFLQFMAGNDGELHALDRMYTNPVVGTFPLQNQHLADLLGIRYLLQPGDLPLDSTVTGSARDWEKVSWDSEPTTYNFIPVTPAGSDCGIHKLPPYVVYRNRHTLPRVMMVAAAVPLPERDGVLSSLQSTDFRRQVLLEGWQPALETDRHDSTASGESAAVISEYLPNRITIGLPENAHGFLVLNDLWFPGWQCTVDSQPVPVYRANYAFRAVEIPDGAREAVFEFAPQSYRVGRAISAWSALTMMLLCIGRLRWRPPSMRYTVGAT
jgi:hypothetical protein